MTKELLQQKAPCIPDYYVPDYFELENHCFLDLTRKNAYFINSIARMEYPSEFQIIEPDNGFNPEEHHSNKKGKYCGSVDYWFQKLQKNEVKFSTGILGAVISIDTIASTHLEASVNGRVEIRDRICECCDSVESLKGELERDYASDCSNHLIAVLTKPIASKSKGERHNISFATKFCAYAAKFLGTGKEYSKYDNIVSDALPYYEEFYLKEKQKKDAYKVNSNSQNKHHDILEMYRQFAESIEKIRKTSDTDLSKEEIDYIIWYGNKGRR